MLADFLESIKVVEVHLTFIDVPKAADYEQLTKWAYFDRVSESLAEFEGGLSVSVIHGSLSRLLSRNDNKLLA